MSTSKNDILQGTLTLLVLKTLASNKRMHGYAITTHVQRVSADLLRVEEGSLYPALHRMEQQGWLRSEWGLTEKNREARASTRSRRRGGSSWRSKKRAGPGSPRAWGGCFVMSNERLVREGDTRAQT